MRVWLRCNRLRWLLPALALCLALAAADWLQAPIQLADNEVCAPASRVVDRHGQLVHLYADDDTGYGQPLLLAEFPEHLVQAVVATEDARFYQHMGVDPVGLVRAAWLNARAGGIVSGGSTITQQVARMLVLGRGACYDRSIARKVREMSLALRLEAQLTKDDILELYLNQSYWGSYAYGAQAASLAVFGKPAAQLDLAECALLAGMLQGPEYYDPVGNREATLARQRTVLGLMVKHGYLEEDEAERAANETLTFRNVRTIGPAPHAVVMIEEQVDELLGEDALARGGLIIETTLDLDLQRHAASQVALHLTKLNEQALRESGTPTVDNAAVLAAEPRSGAILAMVGSPDAADGRIDGAVNACLTPRQPGSALKPFTYALSFEQGRNPADVVADVRTAYVTREGEPYVPVNYDYTHHGPVSLRRALACSYNTVAVQLLQEVGVEAWSERMARLGVTTLGDTDRHGLALTLGSGEVSLIELTGAYACLANGGGRVEPYLIERITDYSGQALYEHQPQQAERVFDPSVAYLVTDILSDDGARAPSFGEQSVLAQPFPAAVKTGTTTDWRDNWTVGYTPNVVVGVWVGNADNRPMRGISGADGAAPIWHAVQGRARELVGGNNAFAEPAGLVRVEVCPESGLLPGSACPHRVEALFVAGRVPTQVCGAHRWATIDTRTGELASSDCPHVYCREVVVRHWEPELLPWAIESGAVSGLELALLRAADDAPAEPTRMTDHALPRILSPDQGARYQIASGVPDSQQQVSVRVAADPGLGDVLFLVDGKELCRWTAPPYQTLWKLEPGLHTMQAQQQGFDSPTVCSESVTIRILAPAATWGRERTGS